MNPVSCIMLAQLGRDEYIRRAVRYFSLQRSSTPQTIDRQFHELVIIHSDGEQFQDWLEQITMSLPLVKVLEFKGTLGAKRNHGVANASHGIVAVWDDDDLHLTTRLSEQASVASAGGFTAVSTYIHLFEQQKTAYPIRKDTTGIADRPWQIVESSLCVNRSLFLSVGGYSDKNVCEDTDLIGKLWATGKFRPTRNDRIIFGYSCTGSGMMSIEHHRAIVREATKLTLKFLEYHPIDNVGMRALEGYTLNTSDGYFVVANGELVKYI